MRRAHAFGVNVSIAGQDVLEAVNLLTVENTVGIGAVHAAGKLIWKAGNLCKIIRIEQKEGKILKVELRELSQRESLLAKDADIINSEKRVERAEVLHESRHVDIGDGSKKTQWKRVRRILVCSILG